MVDLNVLVPRNSSLYVVDAININDRGEIIGDGTDASGNFHALLLVPCDERHTGVEGCDYSRVEAATTEQSPAPRYVAGAAQHPSQSRQTNRFPVLSAQPPSR
jgi:hypothetical protein